MAEKYYIRREHNGTVRYKRYKCVEGWSTDKSICWRFSKQSATKIVEREKNAIHPSQKEDYRFSIERADLVMLTEVEQKVARVLWPGSDVCSPWTPEGRELVRKSIDKLKVIFKEHNVV